MKIGVIDADLIGRSRTKFPNLALMKISGYYKTLGNNVELLTNYDNISQYDKVFISSVFTDTEVPDISQFDNVIQGGTGFFFDKSPMLDYEIEHHFPDYHLYDEVVRGKRDSGVSKYKTRFYTDYSIGFLTRGCFRKCNFCVNRNSDAVIAWSTLSEFLDYDRGKICLLDDNFLGYHGHFKLLEELVDSNKRFLFKQGLDIRLLTDRDASVLSSCKYDDDFTFAFDDINDRDIIEKKLDLWRSHSNKNTKVFVLVAYKSYGIDDILDMFERIQIIVDHHCCPYIMRYNNYKNSEFLDLYTNVARWCNQPRIFKRMSFREYCIASGIDHAAYKTLLKYEEDDYINKYFDIKFRGNL